MPGSIGQLSPRDDPNSFERDDMVSWRIIPQIVAISYWKAPVSRNRFESAGMAAQD